MVAAMTCSSYICSQTKSFYKDIEKRIKAEILVFFYYLMLVCSQNDMMFKFKADIMANLLTVQPTKRVKHMYCMTGMLPSTTNYVRIKEGLTKKS